MCGGIRIFCTNFYVPNFVRFLVLLIPVLSLSIKEREGLYDVYSNSE